MSIPKSWVETRFQEVLGINPPRPPVDFEGKKEEVTFIPMSAVDGDLGKIVGAQTRKLEEVVKGYTAFQDGDILFAKITPCMENGKSAIVESTRNGIGFGSTEFHVLRPPTGVLGKYAHYFVRQRTFLKEAEANMRGAVGQKRVPTEFMREQLFPLPPLAEQHRIVAKIEELLSDLDAGIASLTKARGELKTYRQSVLHWALRGMLKGESRSSLGIKNPPETIIEYRSKKTTKPFSDSTFPLPPEEEEEIQVLPKGWRWVRSESISEFITKGTTPPKNEMSSGGGKGSIPFIKVYNLTHCGALDFSIDPTFVDIKTHKGFLSRSKVVPGDVLMNIVGPPLGKVSIVPEDYPEWNINQAIARFRPLPGINSKYLMYHLLSESTIKRMSQKAKATSGQFNLTLEICRNIPFPLCSEEEQIEIVEAIESRLSEADNLEKTLAAALSQAESLRQSILKQAFEGKLVPQDPNDEPAEKLLERIRAERAANAEAPKKRGRYGGGVATAKAGGNGTPVEGGAPKPRRGRPPGKKATAPARRG